MKSVGQWAYERQSNSKPMVAVELPESGLLDAFRAIESDFPDVRGE
jgi:hypothetical protein